MNICKSTNDIIYERIRTKDLRNWKQVDKEQTTVTQNREIILTETKTLFKIISKYRVSKNYKSVSIVRIFTLYNDQWELTTTKIMVTVGITR